MKMDKFIYLVRETKKGMGKFFLEDTSALSNKNSENVYTQYSILGIYPKEIRHTKKIYMLQCYYVKLDVIYKNKKLEIIISENL